ncbi:MAG: helix-turn-helix transcriptional regulator [Clostridia bacterium]|nr:helix-turn-helix transcriptional regulator [Clostridia bacterium]
MELKISERINRFRKDKNLTQEELASALGVSSQAVSNWERGGYPDITLLPVIAQFFEVSVDELMGSERLTPEQLHKEFDKQYSAVDDYENRIMLSEEYHRKNPNDLYYDLALGWAICNADYAINKNYRGEFRSVIDRLSHSNNPYDVDSARVFRCMVCGDDELDSFMQQLNSPYGDTDHIISYLNNVRMDRARFNGKTDEVEICDQIAYFIDDCAFLDYGCPDEYGPSIKAHFLKSQLRFFERVEADGKIPAGWLGFRGRKQLVLAACLWGCGRNEDGWAAFEEGIEDLKEWYSHPCTESLPLSFDGSLYGGLMVEQTTRAVYSKDGRCWPFYMRLHLGSSPEEIEELLTAPRWAWFNSARSDPRYLAALDWVKSLSDAEE